MCSFQNHLKLILFISLIKKVEQTCVNTKDSTKCCADFYFVDGICKPCEPGFFGPNCGAACPYPNYGHRCTEMCDCPKDQCDVSEGCKLISLHPSIATNSSHDQNPNKQVAPISEYNTEQTTKKYDADIRSAESPITDKPLGNSSLLLIVILSSTSSLVISVVVIVFVVCHRTFRSKGRQNSLRRRSTASTRRPATSYYEIDDSAIALDNLSQRQSNSDMYVYLDKTKVEKSKYATLTQLPEKSNSHI